MLFRFTIILIATSIDLKRQNYNPFTQVPSTNNLRFWLLVRCLLGLCSFTFFTICVGLMPIGVLMVIVMTNPFWTMIMAYVFTNSRIRKFEFLAMVASFIGILIIVT